MRAKGGVYLNTIESEEPVGTEDDCSSSVTQQEGIYYRKSFIQANAGSSRESSLKSFGSGPNPKNEPFPMRNSALSKSSHASSFNKDSAALTRHTGVLISRFSNYLSKGGQQQ